ncbi:AAA family ATPase [Lacrimispora amygdalina]|uniref:AAA family ATPase n=1 Tax=Lacrimispora amygdalina TaxID=253257 RepID=UPI000BE3B4B0|nr:AAA family ATPase [Lacrimispora amygdalina]
MQETIIEIKKCNNIEKARITIMEKELNIKYAFNGTGKSTMAKAIDLKSCNGKFDSLIPFEVKIKKTKDKPFISDIPYSNVKVFNNDYIAKSVFQKTDLVKDAFEIFIRTDEYDKVKNNIDLKFEKIKKMAVEQDGVSRLKQAIDKISSQIMMTTDQRLDLRKVGIKQILDSSKTSFAKPPEALKEFEPFFNDENKVKWAAWKYEGIEEYSEHGKCPFCAQIDTPQKKEYSKIFKEKFDKDAIKFVDDLKKCFDSISEYVNEDKVKKLMSLFEDQANKEDLEVELQALGNQVSYINNKLDRISHFSGYSIDTSNLNSFKNEIERMKLNISTIGYFETNIVDVIIRNINEQITELLDMIIELKKQVADYNKLLAKQIETQKEDVNEFLEQAGYPYYFYITMEQHGEAKAVLCSKKDPDGKHELKDPNNNLSWGEKHALALLLFMFDAIYSKADLIVLDDPISSFDSNKKYAIMNRLFKTGVGGNSFYNKTVLLLTHDFEPVIDYIQVGNKIEANASYLYNMDGDLNEEPIIKGQDLYPIAILLKEVYSDNYLPKQLRISFVRKYIESTVKEPRENCMAYNIISSLIHGRSFPTYDNAGKDPMSDRDKISGENYLSDKVGYFIYEDELVKFSREEILKLYAEVNNPFYKMMVLRLYSEIDSCIRKTLRRENDPLRKFIDESYHIENDYMYCLDFRKFNVVPQNFIKLATKFVNKEIQELSNT